MQMYFKDSGLLLVDHGSREEIENLLEYDERVHGISDTRQEFSKLRVPNREVWFFVPSRNKYYLSTRRKHALLSAAEDVLGETRWLEIQDSIEEQGPLGEWLATLDLDTLKRKIARAREKGLITAAEVTALRTLVNGGA